MPGSSVVVRPSYIIGTHVSSRVADMLNALTTSDCDDAFAEKGRTRWVGKDGAEGKRAYYMW
jgi:hypothetical protein